jgi:hypothetical protein
MAQLIIKGHQSLGNEVIKILKMLGGKTSKLIIGNLIFYGYYIRSNGFIDYEHHTDFNNDDIVYSLEEFLEKYPYKIGDSVSSKYLKNYKIEKAEWESCNNRVIYKLQGMGWYSVEELQPYKEETMEDKGNISDGYHTFNELYEYRMLYNASMFNELAKQGLYDVHKSKRHSDGTIPFGDENWFIVQAELPTGQISNHYEMKDWDLFNVPEKEKANSYDGHTPQDVAKRLRKFLTPKPSYPKTYEECCKVLCCKPIVGFAGLDDDEENLYGNFIALKRCRDAYWKIAGEEMELGKPWEPDWNSLDKKYNIYNYRGVISHDFFTVLDRCVLVFPTEEMQDAFYENFKKLIENCKELL